MHDHEDHGQPQEWEKVLADVTVPRHDSQVPFDPDVMETALAVYSAPYRDALLHHADVQAERWAELERLRVIAKRKLDGPLRETFLLSIGGDMSYREIGRRLNMPKDTVRRHVAKAAAVLKEHLEAPTQRRYPAQKKGNVRVAVLPLDTLEERDRFVAFLNQHHAVQLAYGGDGDFREALVVYRVSA